MKPAYKPVLCVVSSHPIKGASGVPTGFFLAELTHPLKVLEDAGIKTTIASIRGGQPPVDGFNLSDPVNAWYWNETDFQQRLATTCVIRAERCRLQRSFLCRWSWDHVGFP